jgi:predicted nucleic-acid-binding protein
MIAVDTNVLARWLLKDDAAQSPAALRAMERPAVFVAKTALLELEWVFRGVYKLDAKQFSIAVDQLLAMPNVVVEDRTGVELAAGWFAQGVDFADALHLAAAQAAACAEMITFDARRFARRAKRLGLTPSVSTPA